MFLLFLKSWNQEMVVSEREIKQKEWAHGQLEKEKDGGFLELSKIVDIVLNLFYSSKVGPN